MMHMAHTYMYIYICVSLYHVCMYMYMYATIYIYTSCYEKLLPQPVEVLNSQVSTGFLLLLRQVICNCHLLCQRVAG